MPRAALATLPLSALPRRACPCPAPRHRHRSPFSRSSCFWPNWQPKPRQGVKNWAPQIAPQPSLKTHANPPGITPVAPEPAVGCSVAAESVAPLTKAEQLALNAVNGRAFEQAGIKGILSHVGLGKNTGIITEVLPNGTKVRTILDASGRPAGLVEFKDVLNLSRSDQLAAQLQYAARSKTPYNLVVSPTTQSISKPLLNDIQRVTQRYGGGVYRYDPATDILTPWGK